MKNIIDAIEKSLKDKNWYSALVLSLILPDICAKLEGSTKSSAERYAEWFDKYLGNSGRKYDQFLTGHDCYALRCSFLHEGHGNIEERNATERQREKDVLDRFIFHSGECHRIRLNNNHFGDPESDGKDNLVLSVETFCQDILEATKEWLADPLIDKDLTNILKIHERGLIIGGMRIG